MSLFRRTLIFAIISAILAFPLDTLHVVNGVLAYPNPVLGIQAWWVPVIFFLSGALHLLCHHYLQFKLNDIKQIYISKKLLFSSFLPFFLSYGSSSYLKHVPMVAIISYLIIYFISIKFLWKETIKLLIIFTISTAIVGPLVESIISYTGNFYYINPDFFNIPKMLPFIYINFVFATATFDNYFKHTI